MLKDRFKDRAGYLSGGEQQMLAIGRALMAEPRLMLIDEVSLGLAPLITQSIFERLGDIRRDFGTAMLVVEQNARLALEFCDHAYVLENGPRSCSTAPPRSCARPAGPGALPRRRARRVRTLVLEGQALRAARRGG